MKLAMPYRPLHGQSYRPQFSGHETFPLRYGWLKKAFDRVAETEDTPNNKPRCWGEGAIARFGVGKNMVASIRYWATNSGIIKEPAGENSVKTTVLGQKLFGIKEMKGIDPYMEHPATLWLIHWQLASRPERTTWFWAFSHYPAITFSRGLLAQKIGHLAQERAWSRVSNTTIKNDVACFVRTYVARQPAGRAAPDEALESPLTELGLIRPVDEKDGFRFVRGSKPTLGHGVFVYALLDFWYRYSAASTTLSFEAIAHAPGSPGRLFAFEENDVVERLNRLEDVTRGKLRWSESAGLKQVMRNFDISEETKLPYLFSDYEGLTVEKKIS